MFSRANAADPPVIQLDEGSPTPKYQQIAEQVRALVASRRLAPGAALPSVRQLAADLGININTALAAYRALEADGVVLLRRGSRAVIHPRLAQAHAPRASGPRTYLRAAGTCAHGRAARWTDARTIA